MELTVSPEILAAYGFSSETANVKQIGSGHINSTFLVDIGDRSYVLQKINTAVFKDPCAIAHNVSAIADDLAKNHPDYLFPAPIPALNGELMVNHQNEYWRLLPYVVNTVALDTLTDPKQAYEAAKQFGKLSRLLNKFDPGLLKPTIPGFHDLAWRYEQFDFALQQGDEKLQHMAADEIETAKHHHFLVSYFISYQQHGDFPDRVMHHDTKISNVLLSKDNFTGVCVIDLDTLMPGKFISDLGDMIRTYVCAFSENETDLEQITIRIPYFEAMIKGYLSEMAPILTNTEKELILFAGKYMVYMQALRFLTDFLNGSIYYPIAYPTQNLDRARNQFKLLSELFEKEKILQSMIEEYLGNLL
ncbi:MAG: aminoglycoside phosphotransferase family protein [Pedobacter sp.]|nr:aminoglycoside phosphotransferase family protein [Pedobacter sp.]MDQ8054143.1 aminoglycoside phosphotransferase family protein [Pedobacter sp.]